MVSTIRKVSYAYLSLPSKPGEAARVLETLRDADINLIAFSGFPHGRGKAQIDLVTADMEALKSVAKRNKWKLSPIKRAFHAEGIDEVGAAVPPLRTLGRARINIVAAYAIAAGESRFGMLFWVEPRDYNRAAKQLGAV